VLEVDFRLPVGISRAAVLARVGEIAKRHPGTRFEELLPGGPEANVNISHSEKRTSTGEDC